MSLLDQLISHWKLDEASGTRNDSHGSNHLTDNNTVGQMAGALGNAALMDSGASEFLSVNDNASFDLVSAFTLSVRIYRNNLDLNAGIVGKWTYDTDGGWALQSHNAVAGGLMVFVAIAAGDPGDTWIRFTPGQTTGQWYHLVVVYDGSLVGNENRLKIYQDGVLLVASDSGGTIPASLVADTAQFRLGSFGGTLPRYWHGGMDEVSLWSRALSPSEVAELWNGGTVLPYESFGGSATVDSVIRTVLVGGDNYFESGAGGERIPPARERTIDWNITHMLHAARGRVLLETLSVEEIVELLSAYVLLTDSRLTNSRTPTVHGASLHDNSVEATANKNAASGYPGLSAGGKITGSQQTYGTASNTACEGNDARLMTYLDQPQRVFSSLLPNVGTGFVMISGTAYFVYFGRVAAAFTPKHVEFLVSTAGAGAQTVEVGIFSTPSGPNKASQSVTKLEATSTVTSLTTTGLKRNTNAFTTLVPAGTHLWAGIRTAMATTQPTIAGLTQDMSQGRVLSTAASGVLTGAGPWTGAIIALGAYINTNICPDLRLVID